MPPTADWPLDKLQENGFALLKSVVTNHDIVSLTDSIERLREGSSKPGMRHLLRRSLAVRRFAKSSKMRAIAASIIGSGARPIKAILFDKTPQSNWYVTWHQDLTIAVKQQLPVDGFGPWSVKDGVVHVQPSVDVLTNMISLRIHLDNCSTENGAIKFIPGSQKNGILNHEEIAAQRTGNEGVCCAAEHGDVIAMRPLILHSSSQSSTPEHRRVLHLEYAAKELPAGLEWAEASGLDSVELILAIEEEFELEIPNDHAERIITVGDMYEYLKMRRGEKPKEQCLSQLVFYKLRRALIENYNLERKTIRPNTKMTDILPWSEVEEGWPYLEMLIKLKTPSFKDSITLLGLEIGDRMLTMGGIVSALIALNPEVFYAELSDDDEVWKLLVDIIASQLNVTRDEITPEASFARDLGMC